MSINVNVSGNPIRINRGKYIAADPDYEKKELDKRRRMRLEQVRHQSKEIAESVRNKVRKEKKKQLSDFEKREEEKLKRLQNRKLLELQQQYRESLKDIGIGHAQAFAESTQDDIEEEHKERLKEKAKERGQKAAQKLRVEKNKQSLKRAIPLQHKRVSRDVEDARSSMVAKSKKTPTKKRKKKKTKTNIDITANVVSDSLASESDVEELDLPSDSCDCTLSDTHESGARRKRSKSKSPTMSSLNSRVTSPERMSVRADVHRADSPRRSKSPLESIAESSEISYAMDTRISDRISNRRFLLNAKKEVCGPCGKEADLRQRSEPRSYTYSVKYDKSTLTKPYNVCECKCTCCKGNVVKEQDQNIIPVKPTVSLKDARTAGKDTDKSKSDSKVQYYDHKNRFSKEYVAPKGANVKRIPDENIEVCSCSCPCNEGESMKRVYKNDRDAEERGRKAMEKANVHKDYQEMMKQLPVLQKQERIASLTGDKPIFHMDNYRLDEHEKKKQNQMENVYERHFPKTITIPSKNHVVEKEAFKTVDVNEAEQKSKTAQWDEDRLDNGNGGFTITKDSGDIVIETDLGASNKEDYLKYLLDRLKLQKEMLMKEAASLPKNSNLNDIINGLESLRSSRMGDGTGNVSPRAECVCTLPDTTTDPTENKTTTKHKRIREQQVVSTSSSSSTSSTPSKKRKHRKRSCGKIILQNTSTQTSPKTVVESKEVQHVLQQTSSPEQETTARTTPPKKGPSGKTSRITSKTVRAASVKDQASSPLLPDPIKKEKKPPVVATKPSTSRTGTPCKCDSRKVCKCLLSGDQSEVCEILIKIKENDVPEIRIKSPTKQMKDGLVKKPTVKTDDDPLQKTKRSVKISDKITEKVPRNSWRDHLSRNEAFGTSTSTSYFSPPDYSKSDFSRGRPTAQSTGTRTTSRISTDTTSGTKSSDRNRRKIDPRLLTYVKKLLTMSRISVDELGVSSVSDVSTPSVILSNANSRNTSLNQLRSVIKYFNLNPEELAHYLSYSDDTTTSGSIAERTSSSVQSSGYEASKSLVNNASNSTSDESNRPKQTPESSNPDAPTPTTQYAELVDLCQKRITELACMIDKVRMEKQQILSPAHSDKENSTQYMKLPPKLDGESPNGQQNTSSELEQAELNRKLLEIDYSLAERLKVRGRRSVSPNAAEGVEEIDRELMERYRRLVHVQERVSGDEKSEESPAPTEPLPFVPILLDIPRLPKLVTHLEERDVHEVPWSHPSEKLKKPPPAKGLMAAKKFNEDITNLPHELSTIVEVDSQLSTRIRTSSSPKKPQESSSQIKVFENFNPVIALPEIPANWSSEVKNTAEEQKSKSSDGSMPDIVAEIEVNAEYAARKERAVQISSDEPAVPPSISEVTLEEEDRHQKDVMAINGRDRSTDSSTEKSEADNLEAMLKSMGMGWAVSTLRKTRAALDMPSSSSESNALSRRRKSPHDDENSQHISSSSNTSDVTLRDPMGKKLFSTSTSTSLSVSQSLSLNVSKNFDYTPIQGSGRSSDNKHQRTSTPLQQTKSSDSKKEVAIFTGESEVSSVKLSDDFATLRDTTGNNTDG